MMGLQNEKLGGTVERMSKPLPDNTEAFTLKIPKPWIDTADMLVKTGALPGDVTRTAMLRAALGYGLEALTRENDKRRTCEAKRKSRGHSNANGNANGKKRMA